MSLIETYIDKQPNREVALDAYQRWWKSFVPVHVHGMLAALSRRGTEENPKRLNWGEAQMPVELHGYLMEKLWGKRKSHTDTDHAAHPLLYEKGLADKRAMQLIAFSPSQVASTREDISTRIEQRAKIIEQKLNIGTITGVEVDIINSNGELDVRNSSLANLGYVTASIHTGEWTANQGFSREEDFGESIMLETLVKTLLNVADKPIDALSHPLRELPNKILDTIEANPLCLQKVFEEFATRGIALELSLADMQDNPRRKSEIRTTLKMLKTAKRFGVNLVLGTDFHQLYYKYMPTILPDDSTQESLSDSMQTKLSALHHDITGDNFQTEQEAIAYTQQYRELIDEIFSEEKNIRAFIRPFCIITSLLEQEGFTPSDFINTNEERFSLWIKGRSEYKKRMILLEKSEES